MSKVNITITRKAGSVIVNKVVRSIIINPLNGGLGKIPLSTVESQGDLIVGTGDSTVSNVPIGSSSDGDVLTRVDSAQNKVAWQAPAGGVPEIAVFNGRLTLESGVPVSSTDQTDKTRVYLTPYNGNRIMLNVDGAWNRYILTEIYVDLTHAQTGTIVTGSPIITNLSDTYGMAVGDLVESSGSISALTYIQSIDSPTQITMTANALASGSVTVTVSQPENSTCDIFAQRVGANTKLRRVLWTNNFTRATALTTTDGVPTLTGDATMRYVGIVGCNSASGAGGLTSDSLIRRLVGNYYNRVPRKVFTCPGYTDNSAVTSYTESSAVYSPVNGGDGAYIRFASPDNDSVMLIIKLRATTTGTLRFGVGIDTTSEATNHANVKSDINESSSIFVNQVVPGLHTAAFLALRESANATIFSDGDNSLGGLAADPYITYMTGLVNL